MNKDKIKKYEIKKGLECCAAVDLETGCSDCPYRYRCGALPRDALNIITEQEKKIDALKEKCVELCDKMWDAQDDLDYYYDEMPNKVKQAEIEAVKEFAEKLKQAISDNTYPYFDKNGKPVNIWNTDGFDKIDELLKEYEK